jgi:hypothetical protein
MMITLENEKNPRSCFAARIWNLVNISKHFSTESPSSQMLWPLRVDSEFFSGSKFFSKTKTKSDA